VGAISGGKEKITKTKLWHLFKGERGQKTTLVEQIEREGHGLMITFRFGRDYLRKSISGRERRCGSIKGERDE